MKNAICITAIAAILACAGLFYLHKKRNQELYLQPLAEPEPEPEQEPESSVVSRAPIIGDTTRIIPKNSTPIEPTSARSIENVPVIDSASVNANVLTELPIERIVTQRSATVTDVPFIPKPGGVPTPPSVIQELQVVFGIMCILSKDEC